jgi:hypothetical protein
MSYIVTMKDKSEIILPDEAGAKLKDYWLSLKRPTNIEILGDAFSSSLIASIKKDNIDLIKADLNQPALPAKPTHNCVLAGTSIQQAVQRVIKQKHPKDWSKYVKDMGYRNRIRLALREKYPNKSWCDSKENIHVCQSYNSNHPTSFDIAKVLS